MIRSNTNHISHIFYLVAHLCAGWQCCSISPARAGGWLLARRRGSLNFLNHQLPVYVVDEAVTCVGWAPLFLSSWNHLLGTLSALSLCFAAYSLLLGAIEEFDRPRRDVSSWRQLRANCLHHSRNNKKSVQCSPASYLNCSRHPFLGPHSHTTRDPAPPSSETTIDNSL